MTLTGVLLISDVTRVMPCDFDWCLVNQWCDVTRSDAMLLRLMSCY